MEWVRNLKVESVRRLRLSPARALEESATVAAAVALMRAERVGCLLVTAGGRLVGIFTERDLLTRVLGPGQPLSVPLAGVMTPEPVAVGADDPIRTAVRRMQAGGYRHLPVVDEGNRPVGVLSAKQIVRYLVEHFPATVYNQPPDPHAYPNAPGGA